MADQTQTGSMAVVPYSKSRLAMIRSVTRERLEMMSDAELQDYEFVESEILLAVQSALDSVNTARPKGSKWAIPQTLIPAQIADIIAFIYPVACIMTGGANSDRDFDLLALYQTEGQDEGIYVTSTAAFRHIARQYHYGLTSKDFDEMMVILRDIVPRRCPCRMENLIAVNNGIFDYDTKQLLPFSPDYVFLSKSHVNYNPQARNIVIHNDTDQTDWDVESWMNDLSDDPEIVNTLWEILGAIIRPNVPWGKSAWFYSETGNNGKGTLCELMRQLCGDESYASIPLSDFGKDFMLEPLTRASAIIVDENDVGTYIDKAANLKAVITGDTITINRKFKIPIAYQFKGFMVQCLNEFPRVKDKSDSFYRRQLFIPFTKCFTGKERKYIKHDYLHRTEVLEYVLYKVLNMNYYTLSVPAACTQVLDEYKDYVDPVREFMKEHMPVFQWGLLPFGFLYDCYSAWYKATAGNDRNLKGKINFVKDVKYLVSTVYTDWAVINDSNPMHPGNRMDRPEPLIAEYDLKRWMAPGYRGTDMDRLCCPALKQSYRGIYRISDSDMGRNVSEEQDVSDVGDVHKPED